MNRPIQNISEKNVIFYKFISGKCTYVLHRKKFWKIFIAQRKWSKTVEGDPNWKRITEASIQILFDTGLFKRHDNADELLKYYLLIEVNVGRRPDWWYHKESNHRVIVTVWIRNRLCRWQSKTLFMKKFFKSGNIRYKNWRKPFFVFERCGKFYKR